jgi:hypothetical protein
MEIVILFFYCYADAMLQLVTETKVCRGESSSGSGGASGPPTAENPIEPLLSPFYNL